MDNHQAAPVIFVFTLKIKEGKSQELARNLAQQNESVLANEPQLIAFTQYISEDGAELTDIQIHADEKAMVRHMEVAGHLIGEALQLMDLKSIEVYGTLSSALVEQMKQITGPGVSFEVSTYQGGVNRLQTV